MVWQDSSKSSIFNSFQIPEPLLVDPERAAEVDVHSARKQSDEEESAMDDEDILNSLYLKPLNNKYRRVEQDFDTLMDQWVLIFVLLHWFRSPQLEYMKKDPLNISVFAMEDFYSCQEIAFPLSKYIWLFWPLSEVEL